MHVLVIYLCKYILNIYNMYCYIYLRILIRNTCKAEYSVRLCIGIQKFLREIVFDRQNISRENVQEIATEFAHLLDFHGYSTFEDPLGVALRYSNHGNPGS